MPIAKITRTTDKTAPKFFTGGKPKEFALITASSSAKLNAVATSGTGYRISVGTAAQDTSNSQTFNSYDLREVAEHFAELADIMDGKVSVAA